MRRLMFVLPLFVVACGDGAKDDEFEPLRAQLDPRCVALCTDDEPSCSAASQACEALCQIRAVEVSALCGTCLLEGANGGATGFSPSDGPPKHSCVSPEFPSDIRDCPCAPDEGLNPSGAHPICQSICEDLDDECRTEAATCLSVCHARVKGVSGTCALCLLDGAWNGRLGASGIGGPSVSTCHDPEFPRPVADCTALCAVGS